MHTRIAPTPSGYLHIGNACSFLLTRQLANRYGGAVRLRIDDIDSDRTRPEYLADIFEVLHLLKIDYEHGPADLPDFQKNYTQNLRLPLYEALLEELCSTGLVYACCCSRKQLMERGGQCGCRTLNLPLGTANAAWRVYIPDAIIIQFKDERLGKQKLYPAKEIPHCIVRKKDGLPAYHIASLADDLHYHTDYIVRGADLLHSTAIQLYLAQLTGKEAFLSNRFYHHPLIKNVDGIKLSKSAGDLSVKKFLQTITGKAELQIIVSNWLGQDKKKFSII